MIRRWMGIVRAPSSLVDASSASFASGRGASTPQSESTTTLRRLHEVDGLRAVAVLAVMAFHFDLPLRGGFLGVDLFFAISGFVIARVLLAHAASSDPTSLVLRRFYARRAGRLLPAALAVIVATVLFAAARGPSFGSLSRTIAHGAAAFGGVANWFTVAFPDTSGERVRPLLHTWSLGVEEQCYVVLPVVLLAARTKARLAAYATAVLGMTLSLFAGWLWSSPTVAFFATPVRIAPVALGVGLAALFGDLDHHGTPRWVTGSVTRWSGPFLVVLAGTLVPALFFADWTDPWLYRGGFVGIAVVVTAIVAAAAIGGPGLVCTALRSRSIQTIADRSYCLYLVHFPVAYLFGSFAMGPRTVLRVLVSFLAAEGVHRLVEYRFLRGATPTSRWRFAPLAMVGAGVSGFVLAAAGAR